MQRYETKYDLLNAAYKDTDLKKGTIALLQYLVHKSNKEQCFPAVETIASALNVCKRTVQYNMRKLEKAGYIIRKDRWYNHQQLTNQYVFNLGITEDIPRRQRYSDKEREKIGNFFKNIPENEKAITDSINQDENNQSRIKKAADILKIYNMPLSSREKLLLIYLFHRADKKGMVYDIPKVFMEAIGVEKVTFVKLLKKLRARNLIRVRYAYISGKKLILVRLTSDFRMEEKASANCDLHTFVQKPHKTEIYKKQKLINNMQIKQEVNVPWKKSRRIRKKFQKLFTWGKLLKKCKGLIQSRFEKVRIVLRL